MILHNIVQQKTCPYAATYDSRYGTSFYYSQRTPTLLRSHAPSYIYRELKGEFQVLFVIYLFYIVCYKVTKRGGAPILNCHTMNTQGRDLPRVGHPSWKRGILANAYGWMDVNVG